MPGSDSFAGATLINSLPFADSSNTSGATTEPGEPAPSCSASASGIIDTLWWRLVTPPSGAVKIDLTGTAAVNPCVAVYTGTVITALAQVQCYVGVGSFTFQADGISSYYLQIGTLMASGAPGPISLAISPPPAQPLPSGGGGGGGAITGGLIVQQPSTSTALITPAVYDEIRAAIQIDLTAEDIPDEIIDQDQFSGAAERYVWMLVGQMTSIPPLRGTTAWPALVTAAVLFCAARLVTSLPQLTAENFAGYSYSRKPIDLEAKAVQLAQRGMSSLTLAIGNDLIGTLRPGDMWLAPGGRGVVGWR